MSRKKSIIWQFFTLAENTKFAKCKKCGRDVSRGGTTAMTYNTTNLVNHLKKKHADEYEQYSKSSTENESKATRERRQLSIEESTAKRRCWDINDPRSQNI